MTTQKRTKRVHHSTYVEITSGRRSGAFKEVPLKYRKKHKQEAPKPQALQTLESDMQDIEPIFEQLVVEDGDPYTSSNSSVCSIFILYFLRLYF